MPDEDGAVSLGIWSDAMDALIEALDAGELVALCWLRKQPNSTDGFISLYGAPGSDKTLGDTLALHLAKQKGRTN